VALSVLSVCAGRGIEERISSRVVAVVLNWNAWPDTIECVESLLASKHVPRQIVICDNGSRDDSIARLKQWGATQKGFVSIAGDAALSDPAPDAPLVLVELPYNGGYAYGNNIGLRYAIDVAGAEFVWILNNDTVVERDALERMLAVADSNARVGIVGSKLLRHDIPDTIQAMGGGYIIPVLCHDTQLGGGSKASKADSEAIPLDHLVGASLLIRAEAVREVGLIDESYFLYREETDWCIRMRRAGWKLYCCPGAIVWHKQSHSIGFKSPLHDYYAVRNMLRLVWKFYPLAAPVAFAYFALRSVAPKLARLEFARLVAVLHAFSDFFSGVSGRSPLHTDQMLVKSYVAGIGVRPTWRPSLRAAALGFAVLAGGAMLLGDAGRLPAARRPVAARPAVHAPHPHARTISAQRATQTFDEAVSIR
jgi:GT2 family glycosyltransferase